MKAEELRIGNLFLDGFKNQKIMLKEDFLALDIEAWAKETYLSINSQERAIEGAKWCRDKNKN